MNKTHKKQAKLNLLQTLSPIGFFIGLVAGNVLNKLTPGVTFGLMLFQGE